MANELDAPVMGKDSDFYIFNIKQGYISFEEYDFTGRNTTVKKFSFDGFVRHLAIDSKMLPLLASLLGNDYISYDLLSTFHNSLKFDCESKKVPVIASFLSQYQSISDACGAVIELYQNDAKSEFAEKLPLSIKEYQKTGSNLIGYFVSNSLSCNVCTYNGCSLPQWIVKLYREGLIASEGLNCLCNRKIFLRPQSEDVSLPSTQICAEGLRRYYYKLALNLANSTVSVTVIEFDREGSTLAGKKVNLTPKTEPQIHDIPKMSDAAKRSCLLSVLDSDLPFIHGLPIKHQLVASALRYWVIHSEGLKPAHLAALLVHYVGEKQIIYYPVTIQAVHGFSQWQNVLYWVERLNALFSSPFPTPEVAKLYDGVHVCWLYQRLTLRGQYYCILWSHGMG